MTNTEPTPSSESQTRTSFKKSWEAELLISGGALLTVWQAASALLKFYEKVVSINFTQSNGITMAIFALFVLGGGFFIHLVLRSFWFAMRLLEKLNPGGINFEKVKLGEPYLTKMKSFNLRNQINKVDRVCSTIFASTFVFTLIIVGFGISITLIYIPLQVLMEYPSLEESIAFNILVIPFFVGWFLFMYLDLFTGGLLRRGKIIGRIYYPVYTFFNLVSLGFLWRPLLVTIVSNLGSKKIVISVMVLVILIAQVSALTMNKTSRIIPLFDTREHEIAPILLKDQYYRDKLEADDWMLDATIQTKIVTENYLEIYVSYSEFMDKGIDSLKTSKKYFTDIITLSLNDSNVDQLKWAAIELSNGQKVAATIVDITMLPKSLHRLGIKIQGDEQILIPFWKQ